MDSPQLVDVKARLASAESSVERSRLHGSQEQYLQASFLVESLEHEIDALLRSEAVARQQ